MSFQLPSIEQMNDSNDACKVFLNILRSLNTSDLSFTYMLFSESTLIDIVERARGILEIDQDSTELSADEILEYRALANDIEEYVQRWAR